jgi:hypothetical protein
VFDSLQINAIDTLDIVTLTTAQLNSFSATALGYGLNSAQADALTTLQIAALSTTAVDLWGTSLLKALDSAQLGAMTTASIYTLNSIQIAAIETADVLGLSTTQMKTWTTDQIQAMTTAQFDTFTTQQLAGIQTSAITYITSAQLNTLASADVAALGTLSNGSALSSTVLDKLLSTQINALTASGSQLARWGFVTPLALDLDGDGVQTVSMHDGVNFDINNDGVVDRTGWISRSDGLLVRDLNGDGAINNGGELFGSGTVLANGKKASDGYAALSTLDSNLDGLIDMYDSGFDQLLVWTDRNGNGVADKDELSRLTDLGIKSISLDVKAVAEINNGNLIGLMGGYKTQDEIDHAMGDVWFQTDVNQSDWFDLSAAKNSIGTGSIDLRNLDSDRLKLSLNDVLAMGQPDIFFGKTRVTITGDSGDSVYLGADTTMWSAAGSVHDGADSYMVYVNAHAQLLISDKVQINLF